MTFLRGRTIGRGLFRCCFNIVPNCIKCNVHKTTKGPLIPTQNFQFMLSLLRISTLVAKGSLLNCNLYWDTVYISRGQILYYQNNIFDKEYCLSKIMELLPTTIGGIKIGFEGYMYTKKSKNKNTISWQCARKSPLDCKGSLQTSTDISILLIFCTLFVRCR